MFGCTYVCLYVCVWPCMYGTLVWHPAYMSILVCQQMATRSTTGPAADGKGSAHLGTTRGAAGRLAPYWPPRRHGACVGRRRSRSLDRLLRPRDWMTAPPRRDGVLANWHLQTTRRQLRSLRLQRTLRPRLDRRAHRLQIRCTAAGINRDAVSRRPRYALQ